jgi:hypothetical protein
MEHLDQITAAVELGRTGDRATARAQLLALWDTSTEPQTRCVIAHFLADLQDKTEDELTWDLRALELVAEDSWLPSLHLSLADDYRRLGNTELAKQHLALGEEHMSLLGPDAYGDVVRAGLQHITDALAAGSTERLPSNPST